MRGQRQCLYVVKRKCAENIYRVIKRVQKKVDCGIRLTTPLALTSASQFFSSFVFPFFIFPFWHWPLNFHSCKFPLHFPR